MNTPPRNRRVEVAVEGRLTTEDKEKLIQNLDIEVTVHRRRCEELIEQLLENFMIRHSAEITRVPRSIRQMKLKDFDAYGGNIQACVQAMTKQRIADNDGENNAKKRKWQEIYVAGQEDERSAKTPRIAPQSPVKATPKANKARALFPKTPTRTLNLPHLSHTPKPTNIHGKPGNQNSTNDLPPSKSRHASPIKQTSQFKPASTTFNPILPQKTPVYPRRQARQNEHVMSINGTPLSLPIAPPFAGSGMDDIEEDDTDLKKGSRTGGGFVIKRDPSYHNPSYSMDSSTTAVSSSSTGPVITLSTHRGHTIQFDPLTTSPGSLDRIPNLTDSAKKQVKDDTARVIQALGKWRL